MPECLTLKKSNCRNCYKCIRHCPVKSIKFSGNQAHIIEKECILCGQCFVVCPQNAKQIVDETEKAKVLIQSGAPVVASLAPSFVANYDGVGVDDLRRALKVLGFANVEETALGATMVKSEYERILREDRRSVVISSCCHSVNLLIQKYFPKALGYLADVVSPMQAHCMDIKRRMPDAKTVFIGPCVAKKDEAEQYDGLVDAVLTFEELTAWLDEAKVPLRAEAVAGDAGSEEIPAGGAEALSNGAEIPADTQTSPKEGRARFFPTGGGILKTMTQNQPGYTYISIDGMDNCMAALKDIEQGRIRNCFVEMSACTGSCIGGPVMEKNHHTPVTDYVSVAKFAGAEDFRVEQPDTLSMKKYFTAMEKNLQEPSEAELQGILRRMGKLKPEDELNCGSCGYNTCRDKAAAIFRGKADLSMCLPFLKDKAESFSDTVVSSTPNGLIVLNEDLEVQQINEAALKIVNMTSERDVLGEQVIRILDVGDFAQVLSSGRDMRRKRVYLAEYDKYVEQTIIHDRDYHVLICIMRDVTEEVAARERKESMSRQTVEIADKVVDKQMRIVQEIASLLGETAAETKIALTKLKESLTDE